MMNEGRKKITCGGGAALIVALAIGCGGDGGGGGTSDTSTVNGNVSSASASIQQVRRSWLAWANEELLGFAKHVFAQASTDLDAIQVQAGGVSDITDGEGDFDLPGAPTGNVTVTFARGNCQGEVVLPDVTRNAVVTLEDVDFDCTGARPAKVSEIFRGVIRNVPGSPNGNLNVCVVSGGSQRTRVVKIQDATFADAGGGAASFGDLDEGQLIEADGEREGLGASSALDADTVQILGAGNVDDCTGQSTPTPEPTGTPTPEPTTTATAAPTPTETPTT